MKCPLAKEMKLGTKIELEHKTLFPKKLQLPMAKKIARQHINEKSCYYSKWLIPMEIKMKGGFK